MRKKTLNTIEIILEIVALVSMFFTTGIRANVINSETVFDYGTSYQIYVESLGEGFIGLLYKQILSTGTVGVVLFVAFWGLNIAMCAISIYQDDGEKDSIGHIIVPVLLFLSCFAVFASDFFSVFPTEEYTSVFTTNVILTASFLMMLVAFLKRSRLCIEGQKKILDRAKTDIDIANELSNLKELADRGVITQKEFEKRKKKLLR